MHSKFVVLNVSLEAAAETVLMLKGVRGLQRPVALQGVKAASSCPLNIAEANGRTGDDRLNRFRIALGSAMEAWTALELMRRLGEAPEARAKRTLEQWCSVERMLTKLSRG